MTAADRQAELDLNRQIAKARRTCGHGLELYNELCAAGWGLTPQHQIPADWRTRPGPDAAFSREKKQALSAGLSRGWGARRIRMAERERRREQRRELERQREQRAQERRARLKDVAARMRAKYITRRRISQKRNAEKRWENLASRKSLKGRSKKV